VRPGAKRTALLARTPGGEWKLSVSAPAVEGRANEAVMELLSELLGVKRRQLTLVRGETSRSKVVDVEGMSPQAAETRLAAALAPGSGTREQAGDEDGE